MGEVGVQSVKLLFPRSSFHCLLLSSAQTPGPPLGAGSSAPTRPATSRISFFFFFPFWKLALACVSLPPSSPALPHPLLRHGPGSGSWKRNKCGKRERKPELNDRMQAT